ncbi:MAG: 30S ribosomal protein S6e, partial [Candidatus Altiarchaeales archaeon]|nr:30S ribosomal protein S6e [Candidatus Altiarchaeales archaeon]
MECKVVVSDPESGKSYQRELKDEKAKRLKGLKLGAEFDGSILGLTDYKLVVTGGSDKSGFPMRKGVHGIAREMVLSKGGVGYNPLREERIRKRLRGEVIAEDIA